MPEREEVEEEDVLRPGELDARLASSRESRACGWRVEKGRDMVCFASCYLIHIILAREGGRKQADGNYCVLWIIAVPRKYTTARSPARNGNEARYVLYCT